MKSRRQGDAKRCPIKTLLILPVFLFGLCIRQEGYLCVDCMSVALRIKLQDSSDSTMISSAKIVVINRSKNDTLTVDSAYMAQWGHIESEGAYVIHGLPGTYSIIISHPLYDTCIVNEISVTQWNEVTCEHANTENLIIGLDRAVLKKSGTGKTDGIILQYTKGHC